MPSIPIIMPQLGESIAEATVVNVLVKPGEMVQTDQDIIEVETSKATMNVASPCSGRIEKFLVQTNESYLVGAVLVTLRPPMRKRPAWVSIPRAQRATTRNRRIMSRMALSPTRRTWLPRSRCSPPSAACRSRPMPPEPATCLRA